jgi:regulator of protease activity HflC (stomatin/prohibitin superfamily)
VAIEQLTVTSLRNVAGGMTLEDTLTSRDNINAALRTMRAERDRRAAVLTAEGQSRAIENVFDAIHRGDADRHPEAGRPDAATGLRQGGVGRVLG